MMEKSFSQREFATLVGLSTATISRMVHDHKLRTLGSDSNRIPASELGVVLRQQLQKYKKHNQLILLASQTEDIRQQCHDNLIAHFDALAKAAELRLATPNYTPTAKDMVPRHVSSLEEVYEGIDTFKSSHLDNQSEFAVVQQNKFVVKGLVDEFIMQYRSLCLKKIASIADDGTTKAISRGKSDTSVKFDSINRQREYNKSAETIPFGILKQTVFYGYDETLLPENLLGISDFLKDLDDSVTKSFKELMENLDLVSVAGTLLFQRADLSLEFFDGKGDLYEKAINSQIRGIFNPLSKEVCAKVANKYKNSVQKSAVEATIGSGIYMIVDITQDMSEEELTKVFDLLDSGIFGLVTVSGLALFPERLRYEIERLNRNYGFINITDN